MALKRGLYCLKHIIAMMGTVKLKMKPFLPNITSINPKPSYPLPTPSSLGMCDATGKPCTFPKLRNYQVSQPAIVSDILNGPSALAQGCASVASVEILGFQRESSIMTPALILHPPQETLKSSSRPWARAWADQLDRCCVIHNSRPDLQWSVTDCQQQ